MNSCQHPSYLPLATPAPPLPHNHARYDNVDRIQTRKDVLLNQECYGTFSGSVCQANGDDANGNLVQFTDRRGKIAKFH